MKLSTEERAFSLCGASTAFPIALVTLLLATRNVIIAFFAVVSVGGIVASVLGMCHLLGWELGTGESIAGVMVIGLAVGECACMARVCAVRGT